LLLHLLGTSDITRLVDRTGGSFLLDRYTSFDSE
jgi:hypothetical protein